MLVVRLPKEIHERLTRLPGRTNRSKSYYVKKALENLLEEQADYLSAVAAYETYLLSGKKGRTFEEIKRDYATNS